MTRYPRISIRITPELDERLTLHAQREGVTRSRIVQNALRQHLGDPTNTEPLD